MGLEKRFIEVQFGLAGEQEFLDDAIQEHPGIANSSNIQIVKGGSFERRQPYGYARSSYYGEWSYLSKLVEWKPGNDIDIIDDGSGWFRLISGVGYYITRSPSCESKERLVAGKASLDLKCPDLAIRDGYIYLVATSHDEIQTSEQQNIYYWVLSASSEDVAFVTWQQIVSTASANCRRAKVLAVGSVVLFVYAKSDGGLYFRSLSSPTGSLGTETRIGSLTLNSTNYNGWDVCSHGDYFWIAVYNSSGSVTVAHVNGSGTILQSLNYTAHGIPSTADLQEYPAISVSHDRASNDPATSKIHVLYGAVGTKIVSIMYQANLGSVLGANDSQDLYSDYRCIGLTSAFMNINGNVYAAAFITRMKTTAARSTDTFRTVYSAANGEKYTYYTISFQTLIHKAFPFKDGVVFGQTLASYDQEQIGYYLTWWLGNDAFTQQPMAQYHQPNTANIAPANAWRATENHLPAVAEYGDTLFWASVVNAKLRTYDSGLAKTVYRTAISLNSLRTNSRLQNVRLLRTQDGLILPGSIVREHTGVDIVNVAGRPERPVIVRAYESTGGSLTVGTYYYKFLIRVSVPHKQWLSIVSNPIGVEVTSPNAAVALTLAHSGAGYGSTYPSPINEQRTVEIYRTLCNGSVYYKLNTALYDPVVFDYYDGQSDASLALNEQLYTEGGVLESYPCPPAQTLDEHQNRLWAVHMVSGDIYYSKQRMSNEGYAFNPALVLEAPGGEVAKCIVSLTWYHLLIFMEHKTFFVLGEGPNDKGEGGSYAVQQISPTIGCINVNTVIKTSEGVYFGAEDGIYKIPIGLSEPVLISQGIQDTYRAKKLDIVGADEIVLSGELRWTVSDGTVLVYNKAYNTWNTWTISFSGTDITSSFRRADGSHGIVSTGTSYDTVAQQGLTDTELPSCMVETPWIKLAGIMGYQRVWRALLFIEKVADNARVELEVKIYTDYKTTESALTQTVTLSSADHMSNKPQILPIGIANQRCSAIKFRITASSTYANEGHVRFKSLRLEYGVLRGHSAKTPRLNS